jgi:hypothetical protein
MLDEVERIQLPPDQATSVPVEPIVWRPSDHGGAWGYTPHQGSYFAHRITLEGLGEEAFAQSLSTARVDMNPHQVDAALFALSSPLTKRCAVGRRSWLRKDH